MAQSRRPQLPASPESSQRKLGIVVMCTVLLAAASLVTKLSRRPGAAGVALYEPIAAVMWAEALKLAISAAFCVQRSKSAEGLRGWETVSAKSMWLYAVPAALYSIDNILFFVALSHLDPPTYQVLSNLKILTTAVLFRLIFARVISAEQWLSLLLLFCGVVICTISRAPSEHLPSCAAAGGSAAAAAAAAAAATAEQRNMVVGVASVCAMAMASSLSNLFVEWVYKGKGRYDQSIHLQNAQLYLFGVLGNLLLLAGYAGLDSALRHFDGMTWAAVSVNAATGLAISCVLKYVDNLHNVLTHAASVPLLALASWLLLDFRPTLLFWCSVAVVLIALAFFYGAGKRVVVTEVAISARALAAEADEAAGEGQGLLSLDDEDDDRRRFDDDT